MRVPRSCAITALKELDDVQRQVQMGVSPDLKKLLNLSVDTIDWKPGEVPAYINALTWLTALEVQNSRRITGLERRVDNLEPKQ